MAKKCTKKRDARTELLAFNLQNDNFERASRFLYISCRFCTTTTWKCLISRFMENVNKQRRNFISLSELVYGPLKFNFRRVAYILQSKWVGIIAIKNERTQILLLSDILVAVASRIIGTLKSNHVDGNENVKKPIGLISKTATSHVHHAFLYIFSCFCTTTTWKCQILRFMEDVNKQRRNFNSLSELGYGPLKFSFRRVGLHLTK